MGCPGAWAEMAPVAISFLRSKKLGARAFKDEFQNAWTISRDEAFAKIFHLGTLRLCASYVVSAGALSMSLVSNSAMTFRKWAVRVVRLAVVAAVSLVLIAFLAVQIQQRMLRWRAERLLADMHQIRLYQSTWGDAQRLMHRWGGWGYYDGSCTTASCKYEIEMDSIVRYNPRVPRHAWLVSLLTHDRFNLYQWFGGRVAVFHASFTVHDGTIWRESTWMGVSVPRRRMRRHTDVDTILNFDDFRLDTLCWRRESPAASSDTGRLVQLYGLR